MHDSLSRVVRILFVLGLVPAALAPPAHGAPGPFAYVSPVPGSSLVSPRNNIAIRPGPALDVATVNGAALEVAGSRSGAREGRLRLSADGRTILFDPREPWALGETVRVRLRAGVRTAAGALLPALEFEFGVTPRDPHAIRAELPPPTDLPPAAEWPRGSRAARSAAASVSPCDTLLPGLPEAHRTGVARPSADAWFVAPWVLGDQSRADLLILDDLGKPLYQRTFWGHWLPVDFKRQPNGLLTFFTNDVEDVFQFYAMDSAYAIVDSFATGNGYVTDLHELQLLPNGHALVMGYDPLPVGMDTVVTGGDPNAIVYGLVVQELDGNKDVVFQWRSWDHFQITDGSVSPLSTLTGPTVDYVHANSIDLCPDGNLVISSRHMNEISKIDRQTGDVIWRLGLHAANNQFTFPNDTRGFSHQHDARQLPNGHLTLFDNGNYFDPLYSRALEYELDEVNHVATLVWEHRDAPDVYGGFMGNAQRHEDGSSTVGWGGSFGPRKATAVHADGSIAAELVMDINVMNYRTFRFPWRTNRFLTDVDSLDLAAPPGGNSLPAPIRVWNHWDRPVDITCLRTASPDFTAALAAGELPVTLAPGESTTVHVLYTANSPDTVLSKLYVTQVGDSEMVATSVVLRGRPDPTLGVEAGEVPGARLASRAYPNPLRARTTIEYTLPGDGRVELDVFDLGGRRVASLASGWRAAGRHEVEWSAAGRAAGLYFYRLRAAGGTLVRKLVVGA